MQPLRRLSHRPLSTIFNALIPPHRYPHHLQTRLSRPMTSPSSKKTSVPHIVRTAAEPRQNRLYNVHLSHITQANPTVRLLRLALPPALNTETTPDETDPPEPFTFLPGQWLDVHIPSVSIAGGFSITSTPADAQALPSLAPPTPAEDSESETVLPIADEETGLSPVDPAGRAPYLELAVQYAPSNPASAWLWKPQAEILGTELSIRVGGSFVWPPAGVDVSRVRNVVLVAGGVGINPLISILAHLTNTTSNEIPSLHRPCNIHILYSSKLPDAPPNTDTNTLDQILFLSRLRQIIRSHSTAERLQISLDLFLTGPSAGSVTGTAPSDITVHTRRITQEDLRDALAGPGGTFHPEETVCYICGPPGMTDEFVAAMQSSLGQKKEHVFYEKWW